MTMQVIAVLNLDLLTAIWLGLIGACIGSFLNVVAYRLPLGMSVVWKPSHCPRCNHPIRARDNVPVLGWLLLRGKCRDCQAPISPRYAIIEALMGLVFFGLAYRDLIGSNANPSFDPLAELPGTTNPLPELPWAAIGAYVFHCLLACAFTVLVLLRLDRNLSSKKLGAWSIVILLAWWLPELLA